MVAIIGLCRVAVGHRPLARQINGFLAAGLILALGVAPAWAQPRLMLLGDSLTAGYGLPRAQAFPARLQAALQAAGLEVRVVDAGVSGDTTAGGLARLDWAMAPTAPEFAIVQLGGNDGLRGLDPRAMESNLERIIVKLKDSRTRVLVAGMLAPPNLGREYGQEFNAVFGRLSERHGVALYPFFLDGVAAEPSLNQADGIHPNARGVEIIVERILPHVKRLIAPG
jgi:acyl-CoA thioesterase-1